MGTEVFSPLTAQANAELYATQAAANAQAGAEAQAAADIAAVPQSGNHQIAISCLATPLASVGTWVAAYAAVMGGGICANSSAALNDSIEFYPVWMDAGTWQIDMIDEAANNGPQVTASLIGPSGTLTFSTYQDQYAASAASVRTTIGGLVVPTSGLYSLKLTCGSKNASSSGYECRMAMCILTKTA